MSMLISAALILLTASLASFHAPEVQEAPTLRLVRDLRIDATEQDLSPITYVAVAPNGTIAVAQNQDGVIRFFDAKGAALGSFGRKGQGPGEFQGVGRLTWIGDTLVVADLQQRRFTLISPDRKLVRSVLWLATVTVPPQPELDAPRVRPGIPRLLLADRSQITTASLAEGSAAPNWPGGTKSGTPVVRADSAGALQRLITWVPSSDDCSVSFDPGGGGFGLMRIPFCAVPLEDAAMDGSRLSIAYVEKGKNAYRVEVVRSNGETAFARSYPYQPVSIPASVKDSAKASRIRGAPGMRAAAEKMQLPESYPPLATILGGRDETTWIELFSVSGDRLWHVLDASGNQIAHIKVPRNIRIQVASRATIWATETDDDGLQHIVQFRVTR
jgi:hypothetical protein